MSSFDAESFRKEAQGKLTEEEINSVIAKEGAGVKSLTSEPVKQETQVAPAGDWLLPALGGAAAGALLVGGKALYDKYGKPPDDDTPPGGGGKPKENKVFGSLKDKIESQKIEPQLNVSNRPMQAEPTLDMAPAAAPAKQVAPTLEELKAKFGLPSETPTISAPAQVAPVNPAQATSAAPVELPSASPVATPESVIVNDTTGASPVDKANAIVQTPETPAVEISKVAPVAATPVEGAAVPRTTKNVLAFPDVPAPVIPPGTPANARRTAEQIAVLKAEDPLNKGYNQVSRAAGITAETPAPEARSFMDRVTNEVFGGKPPASQGGAAPQAKQITNFIETNQKDFPNIYSKLKEIQAKYPTQSGSAHLGMLAGIAGLGLGALGAYGAYKEGKQTGDWTNLGLLGGSFLALSPPAQAAYQAATYSKSLGETPEELKAFGQMLKNSQQAFKVGAGRGVAPPSSYNR